MRGITLLNRLAIVAGRRGDVMRGIAFLNQLGIVTGGRGDVMCGIAFKLVNGGQIV